MEGAFKLPLISRNSKWVSKSVKFLKNRAHKISSKRFHFDGMVVNNSVYCASPPSCYLEAKMEDLLVNENESQGKVGSFVDLNNEEESGESISSSSNFLPSEVTLNDENSSCGESFSPPSFVCEKVEEPNLDNRRLEKQGSSLYVSEIDMMKERFAKLLLGEDMSGCGNGVCTALAISNAITNLCASLFGQVWRLEPLPTEKELMWRREMEWLLSVSDHIVELVPLWQTFPDGTKLEIMTSRPRSDLYANLPALRKLDNMLLEILDSFESSDFWYVDQGMVAPEADGSSSFQKPLPCQENKWWLPVPQVSPGGLSKGSRKMLQNKRDSTNQILKAAMAINSAALAEMDVPDSYFESLPKNGRASLGDLMYRYINSDQFSPECLLGCLDLSSEHQALEIANRVESSIYVWRRRTNPKPLYGTSRSNSKSSWEMVKDLVADADRRELLADRAESLLLCLKQRFPGLPQTTLDTSKIQCNKDVGKSILESYSRVLESLAFNIVARIDDLLYVDDLSKQSDQLMTISKAALVTNNTVGVALPLSATPYKTAFSTPSFSPLQLSKGDSKFRVKNILTDYPSVDGKGKKLGNGTRRLDSFSSSTGEMSPSPSIKSSSGSSKETISPRTHEATGDQ